MQSMSFLVTINHLFIISEEKNPPEENHCYAFRVNTHKSGIMHVSLCKIATNPRIGAIGMPEHDQT